MSEEKTISEQLTDLRRLISTSLCLSQSALELLHTATDGVRKSFAASSAASEALDSIVTKLGFSQARELATAPAEPPEEALTAPEVAPAAVAEELEVVSEKMSCKRATKLRYDPERDKAIHSLRAKGLSHGKIAKRMGMTRGGVYRALTRGKRRAPAATPVVPASTETRRDNSKLAGFDLALFNLDKIALSGATEQVVVELLLRNYPAFTSSGQIVEVADLADETVASPTITRLRQRGVAIESAQQARRQGVNVSTDATGWRLIPRE